MQVIISQGGALALTAGLTYPSKLAGIIGIGCFVMRKDTLASRITVNRETPVQLIHGDEDEVVPIQYGTKTFDFLKQLGINVKMHASPEAGHELPADAVGLFRRRVEEWVPQD
uniref:palmitoyl-protein hydrolase n=1 Tax=Panagrellus redivivus TaxID=6233 RepID=A0A7E4W3G7_PANRE